METFMKKTLLTLAAALVMASALASTANARDGVYLAARGGWSDYNMNKNSDNTTSSARADFGDTWMVSGALGYRYKFFRIEAEYIHRGDEEDTFKYDDGTSTDATRKSSLESDSYMLNAYLDLMPNYWISPFISGGIGLTSLSLTNQDDDAWGLKESYDKDNFTWSAGGGLTLRLNRCLNVDFGYRYFSFGKINKSNVNAHEYYGGLRYTF